MNFEPDKVTWRELSDIPLIACMIDESMEHTEEQYKLFLKAENSPHILDDSTVNKEQLNRWNKLNLTTIQQNRINRISEELEKYSILHEKYFALIKKISAGTIDKILDMDDAELALKVLSGELPDPFK